MRGGAWGTDRQGQKTLDGEDQHRVGNQRVGWTDSKYLIAREREGETWRGWRYGLVHPKCNGVPQARRTNTWDQLGT